MYTLETASTLAKKFVSKKGSRPILTAALVKDGHVWATDSYRLIKIKTDVPEARSSLVHYSSLSEGFDQTSYPGVDRLFPSQFKLDFTINVNEWLSIHREALKAAKKKINNNTMELNDNVFTVTPDTHKPVKQKNKKSKIVPIPEEEQISFRHEISQHTNVEVTYNCQYMIDALMTLKKAKVTTARFQFVSSMRPFLLSGPGIEIIILPVRVY